MGLKHMETAWTIPAGYLTPDERLVLLALADQTHDDRREWGHDRGDLMPRLGLDPGSGYEWLRRRLKSLEVAGFISRRPARMSDGQWGAGLLIRLDFRDPDPQYRPTERADDGRSRHLRATAPDPTTRTRDGLGQFEARPPEPWNGSTRTVERSPTKTVERSHQNRGTSPDNPRQEPRQPRAVAAVAASEPSETRLDLIGEIEGHIARGVEEAQVLEIAGISSIAALRRASKADLRAIAESVAELVLEEVPA